MTKAEYQQLVSVLIDRDRKVRDKSRRDVYQNLTSLLNFAERKNFLKDLSEDVCIRIIANADKVSKVVEFWRGKHNPRIQDKKTAMRFYHDCQSMAQGQTPYDMAKFERIKAESDRRLREYEKKQGIKEIKPKTSKSNKLTKSKGATMAKSTAKKTTSKSTARKARAKKTYTYTQVRALIKRALKGRKTVRKAGRGKSYNTRYAGRVEKGVYTYTLKNR